MSKRFIVAMLLCASSAFADEVSIFSVTDGQVWDTKGSATLPVTDSYTAAPAQKWIIFQYGITPNFWLRSASNPSRCLASPNAGAGAALVLVACNFTGADRSQMWWRNPSPTGYRQYQFMNQLQVLCIRPLAIGGLRMPLVQDHCSSTPTQLWRVWNHTWSYWE
jgi:hypothetical protein